MRPAKHSVVRVALGAKWDVDGQSLVRRGPAIGKERVELIDRRGGHASENITEVSEGFDLVSLTGGDQGEENRRGLPAIV